MHVKCACTLTSCIMPCVRPTWQIITFISCLQDYIGQQGRLNLHGMDADIDVMIESKAKELSILLYR